MFRIDETTILDLSNLVRTMFARELGRINTFGACTEFHRFQTIKIQQPRRLFFLPRIVYGRLLVGAVLSSACRSIEREIKICLLEGRTTLDEVSRSCVNATAALCIDFDRARGFFFYLLEKHHRSARGYWYFL